MSATARGIARVATGATIAAVVAALFMGAAPAGAAPTVTPRGAIVGSVTVPAGGDAYATVPAVAVDAAHGTLYAVQSGTSRSSLAVVDLASNAVTASLPLPKASGDVAVDAARGLVYVTSLDVQAGTGSLTVFDAASRTQAATIPLGTFAPTIAGGVSGVAVDTATGAVYVSGMTTGATSAPALRVLTAADIAAAVGGTPVTPADVPLPSGLQPAVAVDSAAGIVYATGTALSGSSLFAVDASSDAVVGTVPLAGMPGTLAVDASTGTVYVTQSGSSAPGIAVVPRGAAAVVATIPTPTGIASLDVDAAAGTLYAAAAQPTDTGTVNELLTIGVASRAILTVTPVPTPADVAVDAQTATAYVSGARAGDTAISAVRTIDVGRVSGIDRYTTSVAVSQTQFPGTAPVVYVASGADYPDALAAGPAAAAKKGPLLLTPPAGLTSGVAAEVTRLAPSTIVVAGGAAPVSDAVLRQLHTAAPAATITRVSGPDRYATSRALVTAAFRSATTVYLASGANFPDALAAGGAAGAAGVPIVLVKGMATAVDTDTSALLKKLGATNVVIVGGTGVVSPALATSLSKAGYAVTRASGADRYGTAQAVNAAAYTHASSAILATGLGFPDALSATSWAGSTSSPLYLVPGTCVPRAVLADLGRLGTTTVTLVGGAGVLTENVAALSACAR